MESAINAAKEAKTSASTATLLLIRHLSSPEARSLPVSG